MRDKDDKDEFKRCGGFVINTRNPIAKPGGKLMHEDIRTLSNPKWSKTKSKVGEEVTLSVNLKDQYNGANVYFSIWESGADRDNDMPLGKVVRRNKDGYAEAKTKFYKPEKDSEENEVKFFLLQSHSSVTR